MCLSKAAVPPWQPDVILVEARLVMVLLHITEVVPICAINLKQSALVCGCSAKVLS